VSSFSFMVHHFLLIGRLTAGLENRWQCINWRIFSHHTRKGAALFKTFLRVGIVVNDNSRKGGLTCVMEAYAH
ncbi:MAG: hypothetical protein KZQ80_11055, partial [Candidatus Thiodiazotropha sp. (ex Monitilora ramsayi)]|nr:hypothetical protein [Candidatus Thiodiazotropha sp. (ex Monitilora ramsayi)]